MQQLDLFQQEEDEKKDPTLEELEAKHGVFPGSPGWTDEMEKNRLKMIKEISKHTHVLLQFQDGHYERVTFYGHSRIQGVRLLRRGDVFSVEKLRELGVKFVIIEASNKTYDLKTVPKLDDIETELPRLDLDKI